MDRAQSEDPAEQATPAQVGRFQLVDRLAVGGMAEVFLACERGEMALDRLLVIKRILPHLAQDDSFVQMFLNEAKIAARIQHPNVVQIYELGESGGYPYIAMEYVPGSTLKDLIKASRHAGIPLPVPVVVELISQACAGAHAAHELSDAQGRPFGLVHRDLTPHNLMVTGSGHIKLLDFGIAKASELQDEATRTGMLKGKISYMSPEQCRQEELDRRSDIFALGICAWEMLVGNKPFKAKSELATMQAIVRGDLPHVRESRPDVPESVASVLHRAMATDADHRWQTAEQFRIRLREVARQEGVGPDPDGTARMVRELLGDRHLQQRTHVDKALERTLVTLSAVPPADPMDRPETEESTRHTSIGTASGATAGVAVGAIGSALVFAGLIGAVGLGGAGYWYWSNLEEPPPPRPEGDPVAIILAPTLNPEVAVANLDPVRHYLEQELQVPFDWVVADSYQDAAERLIRREADFAVLPHGITTDALVSSPDLQILATKIMDGSSTTDGYIVIPRASDISSIDDLAGKRLCFPDYGSRTGYKLPRQALEKAGIDVENGVVWVRSGSHDRVMADLLEGKCDAGGTYSLNFQGAEKYDVKTAQLRILTTTGQTPHDHFIAHPEANTVLATRLADALVQFDPQKHAGVDGDCGTGPEQGGAATGDHTFLQGGPGGRQGILDAVLLLLELHLGGGPDLDHSHTAGQLGQPLLQLLAVPVRVGVVDLGLDLGHPTLDVGPVARALDDGGVVLGDDDLAGGAQHRPGPDLVELETDLLGDDLTTGQDGHVLQHRLAALAEAGGLDGRRGEGAPDLVDHQGGQGLALDVLGDDDELLARLHHLLQDRQHLLHRGDLALVEEDVGILEDGLLALGVGHEVGRDVALVELHALGELELEPEGVRLLDGDHTVLADLVDGVGQDRTDTLESAAEMAATWAISSLVSISFDCLAISLPRPPRPRPRCPA